MAGAAAIILTSFSSSKMLVMQAPEVELSVRLAVWERQGDRKNGRPVAVLHTLVCLEPYLIQTTPGLTLVLDLVLDSSPQISSQPGK